MDFRGSDSSIILILRGGILMSIGDFPESLSRAILVGCNVSRRIGRMSDLYDVADLFQRCENIVYLMM